MSEKISLDSSDSTKYNYLCGGALLLKNLYLNYILETILTNETYRLRRVSY